MIRYELTDKTLTIKDCNAYRFSTLIESIIEDIKMENKDKDYSVLKRSTESLVTEWEGKNALSSFGIMSVQARSIKLNATQKWYSKIEYWILSKFYLLWN